MNLSESLLRVHQLTKRYGDVTVLDSVSLDFAAGETHALLGANGAGKSTLCKIIAGLVTASGGTMQFDGKHFAPTGKRFAEQSGIQIVQQELNLIPTLTVAENLMLTRLPVRWGLVDQRSLHRGARAALDRLGLGEIDTRALVGSLGVGRQQLVEIAAALDRRCRLLILDEPTAALSGPETEKLFEQLRALQTRGVAIVYISHRLDEVSRIANRVSFLRDGKFVGTHETTTLDTAAMVNLMCGVQSEASDVPFTSHASDQVALRVDNLSRNDVVRSVGFSVHEGERLGVAGLVGSGRTELLRLIFGADKRTGGEVYVGGHLQPGKIRDPSDAVESGIAMISEDRKQNGLLLRHSVRINTTLVAMRKSKLFQRFGWIRQSREAAAARQMVRQLDIRCADIEQTAGDLSGGNQQKVAISKWLVQAANVFLFDEPTRGIDVAARIQIYQLFETLAKSGCGLVIVSSDLEELLQTCDRIVVMSAGRLVADFDRANWSREAINRAAFSGYLAGPQR